MPDQRLVNLAKTLVSYSTKVRPGDWVVIAADPQADELAMEVYKYAVLAGGNVNKLLRPEPTQELLLRYGSDDQIKWVSPFEDMVIRKADVYFLLQAPENTRTLSGVDPAKQQMLALSRKEIFSIYMQRSATKDLRWNITQVPCPALAQDADMSLRDYEDFVYAATFADQEDPVASWEKLETEQDRLVKWLLGKKQVRIITPNADVTLSIEGRKFINSTATVNMPSGEVYTSPVEDSAEGWVEFTYPAIIQGREVHGVRLEFEQGKVVKATAQKDEAFLLKMLDMDEGARRLGELGIGTNFGIQRFTKSILFDEKIGGTFHLAVGRGFIECGSKNESSLHWDLISDARTESQILVDGELFYKDGKFMV